MRTSSTILLLAIASSVAPSLAAPFGADEDGLQLRDTGDLFERGYFSDDLVARGDEILNLVARDLAERSDISELEAREFINELVTRDPPPPGQAESGALGFLSIGKALFKGVKGIVHAVSHSKAAKVAKVAGKAAGKVQSAQQQQQQQQQQQKKTRDLDGLYEREYVDDILLAREEDLVARDEELEMRDLNELD